MKFSNHYYMLLKGNPNHSPSTGRFTASGAKTGVHVEMLHGQQVSVDYGTAAYQRAAGSREPQGDSYRSRTVPVDNSAIYDGYAKGTGTRAPAAATTGTTVSVNLSVASSLKNMLANFKSYDIARLVEISALGKKKLARIDTFITENGGPKSTMGKKGLKEQTLVKRGIREIATRLLKHPAYKAAQRAKLPGLADARKLT